MINLGNNLKKIRESSELSQEIIASKLGAET